MCQKLISFASFVFVFVLVLTNGAQGELVGSWKLDEGSGTTATDSSGYGRNGSFQGDPQWVAGKIGLALEFDGDDSVEVPDAEEITPESITMATWVYFSDVSGHQDFLSRNDDYAFSIGGNPRDGKIWAIISTNNDWLDVGGRTLIELEQWYHVAMTFDAATGVLTLYLDGEQDGQGSSPPGMDHRHGGSLTLGTYQSRYLKGRLDDVKIWDEVLSVDEIESAMQGEAFPYAYGPDPADGALHADTWVTLSWKAGNFAVSHNIYLGDNYDDVSNATPDSDVFRGNQTTTFLLRAFPDLLIQTDLFRARHTTGASMRSTTSIPTAPGKVRFGAFWFHPRRLIIPFLPTAPNSSIRMPPY